MKRIDDPVWEEICTAECRCEDGTWAWYIYCEGDKEGVVKTTPLELGIETEHGHRIVLEARVCQDCHMELQYDEDGEFWYCEGCNG